jgi:hypothetical protein
MTQFTNGKKLSLETVESPIRSASTFSDPERNIVREFFATVEAMYGSGRYNAMWPKAEDKRAAMRIFGQDIIDLGGIGRCDALQHCTRMMGEPPQTGAPDWSFINMALIAKKPPPVKASHRNWRENLPAGHPDAPRIERTAAQKEWKTGSQSIADLRALLDGDV